MNVKKHAEKEKCAYPDSIDSLLRFSDIFSNPVCSQRCSHLLGWLITVYVGHDGHDGHDCDFFLFYLSKMAYCTGSCQLRRNQFAS